MDENDLLSHSLAVLSDSTKVDSDHVPTTQKPGKKGKNDDKNADKDFRENVSKSFSELAKNQSINQLRLEKKELRRLKAELRECDDDEDRADIQEAIKDSNEIIEFLKKTFRNEN